MKRFQGTGCKTRRLASRHASLAGRPGAAPRPICSCRLRPRRALHPHGSTVPLANAQIVARCQAHGLLLRPLPGDVIGICPPLIITEEEIDLLFDRLEAGLDDASGAMPLAA